MAWNLELWNGAGCWTGGAYFMMLLLYSRRSNGQPVVVQMSCVYVMNSSGAEVKSKCRILNVFRVWKLGPL